MFWKLSEFFSSESSFEWLVQVLFWKVFFHKPVWLVWRAYDVNSNMEWTDDKVLHLIDLLKDVPTYYDVRCDLCKITWFQLGEVACLCTPAHQLFEADVEAVDKLPSHWPICDQWSCHTKRCDTNCICILAGCGKCKQETTNSSSLSSPGSMGGRLFSL